VEEFLQLFHQGLHLLPSANRDVMS
jgi:hypothetical protein